MAEPRRLKRYFTYGTNTSVAAATKETLLDLSFRGVLRELMISYNGDDSTGSSSSGITITLDGNIVLNAINFAVLLGRFAPYVADYNYNSAIKLITYNDTSKAYAVRFIMDSDIQENVLVELTNADATNAAATYIGAIYDKEI